MENAPAAGKTAGLGGGNIGPTGMAFNFCYYTKFIAILLGWAGANGIITRAIQATVVPAKAGIQEIPGKERAGYRAFWIPAFAGTTVALVKT